MLTKNNDVAGNQHGSATRISVVLAMVYVDNREILSQGMLRFCNANAHIDILGSGKIRL